MTDLTLIPNPLAAHYQRFRVSQRVLLTGHSHQAWPDRAARGHEQAFADAAEHLDAKWGPAEARAQHVRAGFARLLDARPETIALGASTHELVVRWLSALPLRRHPRLVTTDGEFHSARRQLQRLAEEGIEIVRVASRPAESVGERLAQVIDGRTAGVIVSTVFYDSGERAGALQLLASRCERQGVPLLLDAYHQLNVVPLSLRAEGLERAFVTGGGYKYCQLGEGNCFLRVPEDCELRPLVTGWFAEFEELEQPRVNEVSYGVLGRRFAGATYDPVSHYRAAEVFDFFAEQGLTPELLRELSQHQLKLLRDELDALALPRHVIVRRDVPLERLGGFLVLDTPRAQDFQRELLVRGVHCDHRGQVLRLGPAPYVSDAQLRDAIAALGEVARSFA